MHTQSLGRQANYDILRIVSTVAVILIHVNFRYFESVYATPDNSLTWIVQALINIITRFSVPSFVMLSGAFILSNESNENALEFYKKSFIKIFLPTIAVIFILLLLRLAINVTSGNNPFHGIEGIVTGNFYNLWYIYMLAGLYLLTPIVIMLKKCISWNRYKIAAGLMLLWAVVSQSSSSQLLSYSIGVVFAFLGFYLMGDVIRTEIEEKKPSLILLIIVSCMCIMISFLWRCQYKCSL